MHFSNFREGKLEALKNTRGWGYTSGSMLLLWSYTLHLYTVLRSCWFSSSPALGLWLHQASIKPGAPPAQPWPAHHHRRRVQYHSYLDQRPPLPHGNKGTYVYWYGGPNLFHSRLQSKIVDLLLSANKCPMKQYYYFFFLFFCYLQECLVAVMEVIELGISGSVSAVSCIPFSCFVVHFHSNVGIRI